MANGESRTFTIKVAVKPDAISGTGPKSITNRATISQLGAGDSDSSNNTTTDTVIVEDEADLSAAKMCKPDTTVDTGKPINCTVFIDNHGPSYARGVVVDDTILSNGTFTITDVTPAVGPGTPGCTLGVVTGGQTISCRLGSLANASTTQTGRATITYTINATEGQDINNLATVRSDTPDPNPDNNQAVVNLTVRSVADLAVVKTGPASATAGTDTTYNLTVTNNGPSTAINTVVTDALPAQVTILSVSSSQGSCNAGVPGDPFRLTTCSLGSLAPGANATMTVNVHIKPDALGAIHDDARVSSDVFDDQLGNNLSTVATTVAGSADLSITKTDSPAPVTAGTNLTYTLKVTNGGPSTATAVKITDPLPAGTSFLTGVDENGTTVCALTQPSTITCDLGTMPPGTSKTVLITVLVAPSVPTGAVLTNTATVSSATPDPNNVNNSATTNTTVNTKADLWLDKQATNRSGNPSPVVVYTLVVHNNPGCETDAQSSPTPTCGTGGPSDATTVTVTDKLPLDSKKMTVQYVSPQCAYTKATHTVVCTAANVPAGATVTFVIEAQVQGSVGTILNTATVTSTTPDPAAGNNTNAATLVMKGGTGKK